ncbi:peptidoglycan/xylan/chitin deacetylase (PgdA/CDA1 family) [Nocardioides luteus]|uniref:Glycosyl transferase n=1 Tax=Nocardioides luteus TaxID=1844 RepID=A0ABQ5SVU0_9ACTN|nr:polysaccharide deacetylase family protein [Nocardioides luteus]MDR7309253.1 peptidoglycan/xylan/chitin deacetylase (PgdA/CDA1 family) [Nocardioides luteus]GGR48765.1 glycosyl transferase [Nocardioides luteus]GLJ67658.1 glycosyl transferase [Nocardioides luteus]
MNLTNLCFHGIGEPERYLEPGEARYWVSRDAYESILDLVVGRPEVRISFDDGNRSDIAIGLPGLLERGLTATFFVLAGRFGKPGSLGRDDVAHLRAAGMGIGTHGMDHISWRGLTPSGVRRELMEARAQIASAAGTVVEEAALPRGQYDRTTLRHLRALGYRAVHTSDRTHAAPGAWLQPRFSVTATDDAASVSTLLIPQPLTKRVERRAAGLVKRLR